MLSLRFYTPPYFPIIGNTHSISTTPDVCYLEITLQYFSFRTDHSTLLWMMNFKKLEEREREGEIFNFPEKYINMSLYLL